MEKIRHALIFSILFVFSLREISQPRGHVIPDARREAQATHRAKARTILNALPGLKAGTIGIYLIKKSFYPKPENPDEIQEKLNYPGL